MSADCSAPTKEDVHADLASLADRRYHSTTAANEMSDPGPKRTASCAVISTSNPQTGTPIAWSTSELAKMPTGYVMPLHSTMRETVADSMSREKPSLVRELSVRWLSDDELAVYAEEWSRNSFQGGLNRYRVGTSPTHQKDSEVFAGRKIEVPCVYIAGKSDWGTYQESGVVEKMSEVCDRFEVTLRRSQRTFF